MPHLSRGPMLHDKMESRGQVKTRAMLGAGKSTQGALNWAAGSLSLYLLRLLGAALCPFLQLPQLLLGHGAVCLCVALPRLGGLLLLPGRVVALLGRLNLAHTQGPCWTQGPVPRPLLAPGRPKPGVGPLRPPLPAGLTSFSLLSQGFWALRKPSSAARLSRKPPSTGRWKAPRCQERTRSLSWPCSFSRTSRCSALSLSAAVKKACHAFSSVPYWGPAGRGELGLGPGCWQRAPPPPAGASGARHGAEMRR